MICVLLALLMMGTLFGCGSDTKNSTAPNDTQKAESIDVDLTKLSSTMVYSEVYAMMTAPGDYIGKQVKMNGQFALYQATDAKRNGLSDRVRFRAANVLDELPKLYEAGEKYDVVILDPPAFTKSREATKNAIKGYRHNQQRWP